MSQVSIIDIEGNFPQIPTQFNADTGFAIPLVNVLEVLGSVIPNAGTPFSTVGSGNTIDIQVQIADDSAVSDATRIGLASFDSASFTVDGNGFVTLNGGGPAATNIQVDANTLPGTDPVEPDGAGVITITGGQVASNAVGANVIRSNSLAANSLTIQVQRSGSAPTQNSTLNGVSHFNSAQFTVDANAFVTRNAISLTTDVTGILPVARGGTNSAGITGIVAGNGNVYSGRTITAGAGITVTNGNGATGNPTLAARNWVLISKQIASSSANIDFSLSLGSYRIYVLIYSNAIPTVDGASLRMQISNDNGATYAVTNYQAGCNVALWNSGTLTNTNSTADFVLTPALDNSGISNRYASGTVEIYTVSSKRPFIVGTITCYGDVAGGNVFGTVGGGMDVSGISGMNAFRLLMDTGNIFSGNFYLFGIQETI